jgi:hypothetical protein
MPNARITLKRGTKAVVDAATLAPYEIVYATDTKEAYVYDDTTKKLVGKAMVGLASARPSAGVEGRVYLATDTDTLSVDDGTTWHSVVNLGNVTITGGSISGTAIARLEVVKSGTGSLTAAECSNTCISNYGQSAEMTLTLPDAAAGLSFLFTVITTGNAIHLKAGSSNRIYLDGVALNVGNKVSCSSPSVGNCIAFFTFKTGASTYDWIAKTQAGTWVDGGA